MGDFDFEAACTSPDGGELSTIVDGVLRVGRRSIRRRGDRVWVDDVEVTPPLRRVPVHPLLSNAPVYVRDAVLAVQSCRALPACEPMPDDLVSRAARDARRAANRFMLLVAAPILIGVASIGLAIGVSAMPLVLLINLTGVVIRIAKARSESRGRR